MGGQELFTESRNIALRPRYRPLKLVRFWAEKPNISESDEDNDVLGGDVAGGRNNDESIIVLTDDSENDQNGKEDTPAKLNQAFRRATKRKYTLDEKDRLGKLVVEK